MRASVVSYKCIVILSEAKDLLFARLKSRSSVASRHQDDHPRRCRRGSALIEVLIALVLLAVSGTALITLLGQTAHSIERLRATERQTQAAAAQLSGLSILGRAALADRVGRTVVHGWTLNIERTTPSLFAISIAASDTGMVLLRTTLYRPDTTDDAKP